MLVINTVLKTWRMQVFKKVFEFVFVWGLGVFCEMCTIEVSALLKVRQVLLVESWCMFTGVIVCVSVIYMKIFFFLKIQQNMRFTENRNPRSPNSRNFCSKAAVTARLFLCVLCSQGAGLELSLRGSCFPSYQNWLIHHFFLHQKSAAQFWGLP